jgi:hypothetical protein
MTWVSYISKLEEHLSQRIHAKLRLDELEGELAKKEKTEIEFNGKIKTKELQSAGRRSQGETFTPSIGDIEAELARKGKQPLMSSSGIQRRLPTLRDKVADETKGKTCFTKNRSRNMETSSQGRRDRIFLSRLERSCQCS